MLSALSLNHFRELRAFAVVPQPLAITVALVACLVSNRVDTSWEESSDRQVLRFSYDAQSFLGHLCSFRCLPDMSNVSQKVANYVELHMADLSQMYAQRVADIVVILPMLLRWLESVREEIRRALPLKRERDDALLVKSRAAPATPYGCRSGVCPNGCK